MVAKCSPPCRLLQTAADYCEYVFRVQSRAHYRLGDGSRLSGAGQQTTGKGRTIERATIRARLSTPTLFHLHSILHGSHCTEDTMLQSWTLVTSSIA